MKSNSFFYTSQKGISRQENIGDLNQFLSLNGSDVITAKVSDHHPVVHDGVLFWNIMMQGRSRAGRTGIRYNNGFGIVETNEQYMKRLSQVGDVIGEIVTRFPGIKAITLCEGPIQSVHINSLGQSLKKYPAMQTFLQNTHASDVFHRPNVAGFPNWGLLMLADGNYTVNEVSIDFDKALLGKLANRLQLWELKKHGETTYLALGHFPFGGNEHVTIRKNLSADGKAYKRLVNDLLNRYTDEDFILCADFNLNPYLLGEFNERALDKVPSNNSILITQEKGKSATRSVTVDGILLSAHEKRKYYSARFSPGLFSQLKREASLLQTRQSDLQDNKRKNLQLIPYQ